MQVWRCTDRGGKKQRNLEASSDIALEVRRAELMFDQLGSVEHCP